MKTSNIFNNFINYFKNKAKLYTDKRKGKNKIYKIADIVLSAFSMFFFQSESFLAFQRKMQEEEGRNNAQSFFKISKIATDNHIRDILDSMNPKLLKPLFQKLLRYLKDNKILNSFKYMGYYLIITDGTNYYFSKNIHCEKCLTKKHKNKNGEEEIHYHHQAITPIIASPNQKEILPLMPEFIENEDGKEKQDCEINAQKRWLANVDNLELDGEIILLGDDISSREPYCRDILKNKNSFFFVAKKSSHKSMYDRIDFLDKNNHLDSYEKIEKNGNEEKLYKIRCANEVPINNNKDALKVNWIEVKREESKPNKKPYYNTFITNIEINENNSYELAKIGETRWKVENENNNTIKTKGYHIEHNFGHGHKYLSSFLFALNVLAFLLHTVLRLLDEKFNELFDKSPRKEIFKEMEVLTKYFYFEDIEILIDLILNREKDKLRLASDYIHSR